ncbi:MAG TPA: response regulator [Patescibacteria group bacterium]|jgi:DNA-binding response OmpR family regulator|nr:response regulator [Patescibacteria group bacterium]
MAQSILLVEDEPWLGELYKKVLHSNGYQVTWCQDVYAAMDCIDDAPPQLIILDLLLPWANGIGLLQGLVSHYDLARIPVIVYSNAVPQDVDQVALRHYGVREVLNKATVTPKQLVSFVKKVLEHEPPKPAH